MAGWYRGRVLGRGAGAVLGLLLILLAALPASGIVAASAPPPMTLPGHVLPNLSAMTRLSAVAPNQPLTLTIALKPASPTGLTNAALRARARALSPSEVARAFGQPRTAIDALASYFASYGLSPLPPHSDHLSFQVKGTAAQIEQALSVSLANYRDAKGHRFYATSREPRLPASLATSVQAIFGLNSYPGLQRLQSFAAVPGSYAPADMQKAYNLIPLYAQGLNGAGQTIGILGCDQFQISDIQTFESDFQLPPVSITTVPVDGGPTGISAETTLDLEWSSAIATNGALRYYGFPTVSGGCSLQGLYDALGTATQENVASVLSISLGGCEGAIGAAAIQAFENEFAVAAAQGQSVLVASGDQGAFACGGSLPAVDYPGSSAYVTSVGGTSLLLNSDSSYGTESAWGSPTGCWGSPCGSGGGISSFVGKPSWQSQVNAGAWREVPDVALNADPNTGNVIVFNGAMESGVGGTSIATPQWAGIVAIAAQAAGRRLGLLGPMLYGPVAPPGKGCQPAYHDVTTGNNLYYNAVPGWDMATGWGSPNAANLVPDLGLGVSQLSERTSASVAPLTAGSFQVFLPLVMNGACPG